MRRKNGILVWLILYSAVAIGSTSVIFIKSMQMHPFLMASLRLLGAAAILSPFYFRELADRRSRGRAPMSHRQAFKLVLVPGVIIAVHFVSWTVGARMTTVGNSIMIVNMNPVAMPFAAFLLSSVKPTRREIIATLIAVSGIFVMGAGDFNLSKEYLLGDAVCFASMLCFSAYLAFSRRINTDGRLWTYLVPLYAVGGVLALAVTAATPGAVSVPSAKDTLLVLGLIIGPTVIGHSVLNWAMTIMRPQTVSIVNLFQFVTAVILAFFLFGEVPEPRFYLTTALIVSGAVLAVTKESSTPPLSS